MKRTQYEELLGLFEAGKLSDGTAIVDGLGEAIATIENLKVQIECAMHGTPAQRTAYLMRALELCRDFLN